MTNGTWPLTELEAIELAGPLDTQGRAPDEQRARDLVAAAAWTAVVEPGDAFGGLVRERLGAEGALDLLMAGADVHDWLRRLDVQEQAVAAGMQSALERWRPRADPKAFIRALAQGARWRQKLVIPGDDCWPEQLDDLGANAPAAMWVRGDPNSLLLDESAAIVGSRAVTPYGTEVTAELAERASVAGIPVVSGGAFGVDAVAHRVALAASGSTVCVLAGGLDRFYPSANQQLIERVEETGAVIAEVPSGVPPARWRFLMRNRVIAALASVTVVVEAGRRSGAINTAGHAAALGRPLGAVPGAVTSGTSAGCHRLLKEYGADVIEGGDDLVRLVRGEEPVEAMLDLVGAEHVRVLDAMSTRQARTAEQLATLAGMSHADVLSAVGALTLVGAADARGDGFVKTANSRR